MFFSKRDGNTTILKYYALIMDYCLQIEDTDTFTSFRGQHCSVTFRQTTGIINYTMGICIPDSCGKEEAKILGQLMMPLFGVSVAEIESASCYSKKAYSAADIVALTIISLFCLLCACGTLVDLTMMEEDQRSHMLIRFLLCFSWWTNGNKLLSCKAGSGQLTCLNGLRTLSMF